MTEEIKVGDRVLVSYRNHGLCAQGYVVKETPQKYIIDYINTSLPMIPKSVEKRDVKKYCENYIVEYFTKEMSVLGVQNVVPQKRFAVFFDRGYDGLSFPKKEDIFPTLDEAKNHAKSYENKLENDFFIMDLFEWEEVYKGKNEWAYCQGEGCFDYFMQNYDEDGLMYSDKWMYSKVLCPKCNEKESHGKDK